MSKKVDQWLPLYVADYKADTSRLTTEQHGAYLLLIMDYWRNGPPPDDDTVLAQITGLPIDRWKQQRRVIQRFFVLQDGAWTQKRIEQELAKAKRNNEQKSVAGKASAEKRWGNGTGNDEVTDVTTAQVAAEPRQNAPSPSPVPLPTPSPSPAPRALRAKRASPKTALPDGFQVSERVRAWAAKKGFDRLDQHLESFVMKCRAKAYTYADWDEGFMGAITDDWARLRSNGGRQHLTIAERNEQSKEEWLRQGVIEGESKREGVA